MEGSPIGELNAHDLKRVGKGAIIAAAGATLAYILNELGVTGELNTAITGAICSVLVNLLSKWFSDTRQSTEIPQA